MHKPKLNRRVALLFFLSILMVFITACSASISRVAENPAAYDGKTARVSGQLVKVFPLQLADYRLLIVQDNGNMVSLLSRRIHSAGSEVHLQASVIHLSGNSLRASLETATPRLLALFQSDGLDESASLDAVNRLRRLLLPLAAEIDTTFFLVQD